ncbi:hypothetical protein PPYR_14175 [Photinus pyralis]|uniref:Uncharacterized protein n=1 Tax=Photinus pyralis TaxID=7054 RepID=A0A5N4A4G6_PHOPY|nr:uncharacterized protein LOC116180561 [Photinus pyralis]XP_031356577.1 uncharacterized protein LOC116180632 [Photinus pyralis]KAB0792216.1 hypothetical protein PPYR_14175 [Photinus pyralis]
MNAFGIFAAILFLQAAMAYKDFKEESDWCIERHGLSADKIYRIHRGGHLPSTDDDYLTFIECLWRKIRFLNSRGELNLAEIWGMYYEVAHEIYNHQVSAVKADAVLKKCKGVNGDTPALRAVNMGNCLKNVANY